LNPWTLTRVRKNYQVCQIYLYYSPMKSIAEFKLRFL
jgi:hypothetical protein